VSAKLPSPFHSWPCLLSMSGPPLLPSSFDRQLSPRLFFLRSSGGGTEEGLRGASWKDVFGLFPPLCFCSPFQIFECIDMTLFLRLFPFPYTCMGREVGSTSASTVFSFTLGQVVLVARRKTGCIPLPLSMVLPHPAFFPSASVSCRRGKAPAELGPGSQFFPDPPAMLLFLYLLFALPVLVRYTLPSPEAGVFFFRIGVPLIGSPGLSRRPADGGHQRAPTVGSQGGFFLLVRRSFFPNRAGDQTSCPIAAKSFLQELCFFSGPFFRLCLSFTFPFTHPPKMAPLAHRCPDVHHPKKTHHPPQHHPPTNPPPPQPQTKPKPTPKKPNPFLTTPALRKEPHPDGSSVHCSFSFFPISGVASFVSLSELPLEVFWLG